MDTIKLESKDYNLKDLLDAKYPFLEKFREKAPGTFQHCQNVADLCEAVALELGLDTDIARILGQYHDAGKIYYPKAFYENQNGKNIHDDLDPLVSFHIISNHVANSALILVQLDDFPNELIPPIVQHHGTTVMQSLFKKSGFKTDDEFRYKNTTPPESLEAIVLMICDSVDATIRSIEHTEGKIEDIEDIIYNTIDRFEKDGQIDELKIGHSKKIKRALITTLKAKYHSRSSSDYDDEDEKTVGDKRKKSKDE